MEARQIRSGVTDIQKTPARHHAMTLPTLSLRADFRCIAQRCFVS
jgi:hypothetical protein